MWLEPGIAIPLLFENHPMDCRVTGPKEICPTLNECMGTGGGNVPIVLNRERTDAPGAVTEESRSIEHDARPADSPDMHYVARRLTPTECARLQGFPPDWCSDVPHADSAEYKLWGNGIALPCLFNLFKSIVDVYEAEAEEHEESRLQSDTILTEEVRDAIDK